MVAVSLIWPLYSRPFFVALHSGPYLMYFAAIKVNSWMSIVIICTEDIVDIECICIEDSVDIECICIEDSVDVECICIEDIVDIECICIEDSVE